MENRPKLQEIIRRAKDRQAKIDASKKRVEEMMAAKKPAPKPGKEENGITIKSSTPGSAKRFKIAVDDNGVISAAEIK